ncbi:MAG: hypothetical protein ACLPSM_15260 [Acidimicrobiales bacterium]
MAEPGLQYRSFLASHDRTVGIRDRYVAGLPDEALSVLGLVAVGSGSSENVSQMLFDGSNLTSVMVR